MDRISAITDVRIGATPYLMRETSWRARLSLAPTRLSCSIYGGGSKRSPYHNIRPSLPPLIF
jgi:hypothetical protein